MKLLHITDGGVFNCRVKGDSISEHEMDLNVFVTRELFIWTKNNMIDKVLANVHGSVS